MVKITESKEESQGIFWVIDDELLAFPYYDGIYTNGVATSGNTYNHKKLWNEIKPVNCNTPYNYYPRGRVVITNSGNSVIYMNPNINETYINDIKIEFGLRTEPKVNLDFSEHYKCYLDDGWKPDWM